MKTKPLFLILTLFIFAIATTANAVSLQNGDFEDLTADINGALFTLGTSDFGEWYALSPWSVESGGPTGSLYYFDHQGGGGGDQKAFQPIDTSAMSLSGVELTLSLDYIYEPGTYQSQSMGIALVGLSGNSARYAAYGGTGYDGWADFMSPPADVATARTVLGSKLLTDTSGWSDDFLTVVVDQDYDAIIAVIASSAYNPGSVDGGGIRGIDNVSLSGAPVPEPATLLLLGSGLASLVGFSRKKFFKK